MKATTTKLTINKLENSLQDKPHQTTSYAGKSIRYLSHYSWHFETQTTRYYLLVFPSFHNIGYKKMQLWVNILA